MVRRLSILLVVISLLFSSLQVQAQGSLPESEGGTRQQLATIIFAGLAGAILGLSTLSFVGRPQDKLSNIAIGFAIGIISGTIYTTYKTATQYSNNYEEVRLLDLERKLVSLDQTRDFDFQEANNLNLSYEWTF